MHQAVICVASNGDEAEKLVDMLKKAGFGAEDISLLMPDPFGAQELGYESHTKAPEGISTGVTTGALLGGVLGYLAGIGAIIIPGAGPLIAAGPLMVALSAAAVGGAVGGVSGGLIGMGIPEYEAKKFERRVQIGNTLIAVHCDTSREAQSAEDIFKSCGAKDIHRCSEDVRRKKAA